MCKGHFVSWIVAIIETINRNKDVFALFFNGGHWVLCWRFCTDNGGNLRKVGPGVWRFLLIVKITFAHQLCHHLPLAVGCKRPAHLTPTALQQLLWPCVRPRNVGLLHGVIKGGGGVGGWSGIAYSLSQCQLQQSDVTWDPWEHMTVSGLRLCVRELGIFCSASSMKDIAEWVDCSRNVMEMPEAKGSLTSSNLMRIFGQEVGCHWQRMTAATLHGFLSPINPVITKHWWRCRVVLLACWWWEPSLKNGDSAEGKDVVSIDSPTLLPIA